MGSGLIKVLHIVLEKAVELLLIQDEEVIQAFSPHASQKTFVIWHSLAEFGMACEVS